MSEVQNKGIELVLGAGGVKGFGHVGVLKAIEELDIPIRSVVGVSVGSLVAALYANGFNSDQIYAEMKRGLSQRNDPALIMQTLTPADPISLAVGGPIDLTRPMRDMVERLKLTPKPKLKVVSCDLLRHEPVLFEGESYDLAKALTASCALPTVLRPVWHQDGATPRLLVDGAIYHYNPTDFCEDGAIVSTFRPASEIPRDFESPFQALMRLVTAVFQGPVDAVATCMQVITEMVRDLENPFDIYFHLREMYAPLAGHRRYVDPHKNVVLEIGLRDSAGLSFGIGNERADEMVKDGYETAKKILSQAIKEGRVPTRKSPEPADEQIV